MCSDTYQDVPREAILLSISNQDAITKVGGWEWQEIIKQGRTLSATDSHRSPLQQPQNKGGKQSQKPEGIQIGKIAEPKQEHTMVWPQVNPLFVWCS